MGRPPRAVARARPHRRGHGEAEDRDRELLVRALELLQPSRRRRGRAQGSDPRGGRPAVRGAHGGAERLHHERGPPRRVHPADTRPDRGRHRGAGRRRAARRHGRASRRATRRRRVSSWQRDGSTSRRSSSSAAISRVGRVPRRARRYRGRVPEVRATSRRARITLDELTGMADVAVQSPGVCAGMGTANSMHIVCEALGMALPGSAPVAAGSPKMLGTCGRPARASSRWCGRTSSRATSSRPAPSATRCDRARAERLDQLREAPAGDRDRGRGRRRRLSAVRRLRRQGPAARGDPAERPGAHRGARGRRRRARGAQAARALPRPRRARRDRRAPRRRARARDGRRRPRDPTVDKPLSTPPVDRDRARQPAAGRRHRAARRHRRAHAEVPRHARTSSIRATRRSPRSRTAG